MLKYLELDVCGINLRPSHPFIGSAIRDAFGIEPKFLLSDKPDALNFTPAFTTGDYELDVSEREYISIKDRISHIIDPKTDKVLFYRICKTCMAKSESLGEGEIFHISDTYV